MIFLVMMYWDFQVSTWIKVIIGSNMSSRTSRVPAVRSYRRRKAVLDLDLNRVPAGDNPAGENREQEGPSTQLGPQEVEVQANQQPLIVQLPPPMIDVEAIDDDVIESSPRAFAEVYLPFCTFLVLLSFSHY